jgi:hypothetical protein
MILANNLRIYPLTTSLSRVISQTICSNNLQGCASGNQTHIRRSDTRSAIRHAFGDQTRHAFGDQTRVRRSDTRSAIRHALGDQTRVRRSDTARVRRSDTRSEIRHAFGDQARVRLCTYTHSEWVGKGYQLGYQDRKCTSPSASPDLPTGWSKAKLIDESSANADCSRGASAVALRAFHVTEGST